MKRFIITITLLITLVGSAFAKTTKVGDKQYHIENNNIDAVYEVISEADALLLTSTLCNIGYIPLVVNNNTIDSEVASLTKKFGYTVFYCRNVCVVLNMYNEESNCIDTFVWCY